MLSNPLTKEEFMEEKKKEKNFVEEVLSDYRICCISREASLLARREVLTGKAKFGIIGDGKEVPQVAMARAFKKGDFRSGYYRDQTLMFALGLSTLEEFFAQLYADTENDPFSSGRQMNSHYATPFIDKEGDWLNHLENYNISADVSSTGGQMARALGLALASKKYRENDAFPPENFSRNGNEVCFCTIGDASTSEGVFWETLNAAGVLQVPLAVSVWDDGYGISVPIDYQTIKKSISKALSGFQRTETEEGFDIYTAKAWDYPALCELYEKGIDQVRKSHVPALFHIQEVTQPQGHSTSGSHERYKSKERLQWEQDRDCIRVMRQWIIDSGIAAEEEVDKIAEDAKKTVREAKTQAWKAFNDPVKKAFRELNALYDAIIEVTGESSPLVELKKELNALLSPLMHEIIKNGRRALIELAGFQSQEIDALRNWMRDKESVAHQQYHTNLYSETSNSALQVPVVPALFTEDSPLVNGYQVLNTFFDKALERYPNLIAFGEDVGQIGDVNQGFAGLQEKYGDQRVFDTGIREWTIMGQAIGLAMRGFRPIAEIQYLDYLIYGLEPLSDDLATLRYRTNGLQHAPAIIRTRGHRLEGIWHAGSPIGMLLGALRGMYLLVPRDMTQAAGFYNTLLQSDDPAVVIECLNGYRLKEKLPDNISEFTVPLGLPEILAEGSDVTLVTYGSCVRIAQEALPLLEASGISVELIDVQSLLPFDLEEIILSSLKKTNRIVFLDEDVPGGGTAYMMQKVLEEQGGYSFLDSAPVTITAHEHRPPFGSDGDYFSKPNAEDVCLAIYKLMRETDPSSFPPIY
jgi:pyruvate/2-oxoglutarate/acetoin dehydrogenase E1 component/TPP-dependent pyruvate/acetoin dehydrogenase alpha subunit